MLFFTLAGIPIFQKSNYGMDSIIWFLISGLMTLICITVVVYNIVMKCKESNQYSPLNTNSISSYYSD